MRTNIRVLGRVRERLDMEPGCRALVWCELTALHPALVPVLLSSLGWPAPLPSCTAALTQCSLL